MKREHSLERTSAIEHASLQSNNEVTLQADAPDCSKNPSPKRGGAKEGFLPFRFGEGRGEVFHVT
jgi:hypothetical protein